MAYIRKLPSGKFQATIRGADGKKHTKTNLLRKVVKDWAAEEEAKLAQGKWRDPKRGRQTVKDWAIQWVAARVVEDETRRTDRSLMSNHILPHWGSWRLDAIVKLDVQQWVRQLQRDGVGAPTIRRAYNLFATMMRDAVAAEVLGQTPCKNVSLPASPPKLPGWFTREQVDRIRAELEQPTRVKGRPASYPGHSVMVETMCCIGLRFGEAAAACGGERPDGNPVDWLRGRIRIVGALTQLGQWKEYPKSSKSRREVPVPSHLLAEMGTLLQGRERTARLFVSARKGAPVTGSNWRDVWYAAIDAINAREPGAVPRLDPHDCRHTAASWLVQEGVPLYEVQALLGHESSRTTERYAHLQPDAHGRIEDAWSRIVAHQRRTAPRSRRDSAG